jgi:ubiquinol-cytochrome c reductase cytochrome c1 subunit
VGKTQSHPGDDLRSATMKFLLAILVLFGPLVQAAEGHIVLPKQAWSFEGARAAWDKDELYRGYTVATQVCMACHSFKYVSHRDLMRVGFTEAEVQTLAKALNMDINAKLKTGMDEATAQETFGKVPPDLSLMNRARAGFADYTYALLTGYSENPAEIAQALPNGVPAGAHFNKYYPGHAIAMPNALTGPDLVTYHDGKAASVEQMARDVTAFMQWTAEPELMERQQLGMYVLIYLILFTLLAYFTKRVIWKDVKGH